MGSRASHTAVCSPCLQMNDTSKMRLTPSVEDYLKAIYALTERGEAASTSALAEALDVQPASITGMIKRLADFGYVEHTRYRGVHLTEKGSKAALRVIRRHRILETYLQTHLGFTWDDVHSEAERLEHAASETLIERMATILRHPSHDPHGAPIPTSAGEVEPSKYDTLNDIAPGTTVQIHSVRDEDPERLRYMETLGLTPGIRLTVHGRAPFDGPLTVSVSDGNASEVVGSDLAGRIFVTPVGPD